MKRSMNEHDAIYQGRLPASAAYDYVDPIYQNKDPIAVSIKMRKEEGSILSVIPALRQQNPNKFFFTMK